MLFGRDHAEAGDFYPRPPRGGRRGGAACFHLPDMISIHALREEGDRQPHIGQRRFRQFLSTPSARRATQAQKVTLTSEQFLSTPSARRATPRGIQCRDRHGISIHALREEGDWSNTDSGFPSSKFLSTPSARRATLHPVSRIRAKEISIHALREEGDCKFFRLRRRSSYFYPRPPRGGRRRFSLPPPARIAISIHALREEGDRSRPPRKPT